MSNNSITQNTGDRQDKKRIVFDPKFVHKVNFPDDDTPGDICITLQALRFLAQQALDSGGFNFEVAASHLEAPEGVEAESFFWSKSKEYHDGLLYNPQFCDALFFGYLAFQDKLQGGNPAGWVK